VTLIRMFIYLAFLFTLTACGQSEPASEAKPNLMTKKLIHLDWNPVTPSFMAENLAAMETKPFDGIILSLNVSRVIV
jgi:hypothetical protein